MCCLLRCVDCCMVMEILVVVEVVVLKFSCIFVCCNDVRFDGGGIVCCDWFCRVMFL